MSVSRMAKMRPLAALLLASPGCFDAPASAVLFSCDPASAAECPEHYECRDDGCCHHVDSDEDASIGACGLAVPDASSTGSTVDREHESISVYSPRLRRRTQSSKRSPHSPAR